MLGLGAFMVSNDGGFAGTVWYPIALIELGVLVTVAAAAGRLMRSVSRQALVAIACFSAFVGWSFASIAWAGVRGDAWNGSDRDLLYLLVFVLLASWPTSSRAVWPVLLAANIVVAIEGVVTVEQAIGAANPAQFLIDTRLSEPLGYPNATAALFMLMAWLMIGLASRRWLPSPARGLAFGLAGLDLMLNLLTESRGSVFTLPLVVVAYLVLVPGRLRSLATVALIGIGVAPVISPVIDVYGAYPVSGPLRHAIDLSLVWAVVLALAGWLFAAIDQRLRVPPRVVRASGFAVVAAALLGLVGLAVAVDPWRRAVSAWHSFRYGSEPSGSLLARFGGLGSNRYDFWRVGLIEFKRHPIGGIGADNFLVPYLQLRHSPEEPVYPHSLVIDLLSQTGIVGTLLFVAFLAFAVLAVTRIPAGRNRELAAILVVGASVWLLHSLVDWLWEMPALGVIGMALLGCACGLSSRAEPRPPGSRRARLVLAAAGITAAAAAAASLALPWFSDLDINRALDVWQSNPTAALSTLSQASSLNPLDDRADSVAGAIASRLHEYAIMRVRFQDAVDRSPDDWYANLELGVAASLTGGKQLAAVSLQRAVALDPGEPIARNVLREFEAGQPIDSDAVNRAFGG